MSPPKKDQKKWKPKFPGQQDDGEEDSYVKAQRLVNVYRQLHVLREDLVKRYNETLLDVDSDTRLTLADIPGGRDVRNYLEYLEVEKYGEDFHHDEEEDVFVSREEKAKAKAIADALTSAQEKMNQNQLQAMQLAQEESRKNMEMLARTLAEAKQDPSRRGEIEGLAQSLKKAKADYTTYAEKISEGAQAAAAEENNVQSIMRAQYQQAENIAAVPVQVPVAQVPVSFDFSNGGAGGMEALVTAITEAQNKSAEAQAKIQSETMAKIFSQSQEMTARAMAEAFSKSQQNAAEVQGSIIAKALAESQKNANETLAALFATVQKNGGAGGGSVMPQIVIENSNTAQAGIQTNELLKQQAEAMAQAQREAQAELLKSQKELLDAQKQAILESTAKGTPMPMFGGASSFGMDTAEQAQMIANVISKTQSALLSETMSELIHRQEESQRFQATLMAEAFTKQTEAITNALTESQRSVRKETLKNQAQIVAEAMFNAQKETQKETVAAQANAIARAINSAHNETQSKVFADQARAMAEAFAETNKEALAEQARVVAEAQSAVQQEALKQQASVVAEAMAEKQSAVQQEALASQARVVAEAMAEKQSAVQQEALASQARVVAEAMAEKQSEVQQDALASQARVVAEAMAQTQNANLSDTIDIISQKQMSQTEALAQAISNKKTHVEVSYGAGVPPPAQADGQPYAAEQSVVPAPRDAKPPVEQPKEEKKKKWHIPKMDLSAFTEGLEKAYASFSAKPAAEQESDEQWGYGYAEPPPAVDETATYNVQESEAASYAYPAGETDNPELYGYVAAGNYGAYSYTDENGNQIYYDPNSAYQDENGATYYIDANGTAYYLDENGNPYYVDENGAGVYFEPAYPSAGQAYADENGNPYYLDANGAAYYLDAGGTPYYLDENGAAYYIDANGMPYYLDENGAAYYIDANGIPYYVDEAGAAYYLDSTGTPYYVDENGNPYYLDENGKPYYVDESGNPLYKKTDVEVPETEISMDDIDSMLADVGEMLGGTPAEETKEEDVSAIESDSAENEASVEEEHAEEALPAASDVEEVELPPPEEPVEPLLPAEEEEEPAEIEPPLLAEEEEEPAEIKLSKSADKAAVAYAPVPPPAPPVDSPMDVAMLLRLDDGAPLKKRLKTTSAVLPVFTVSPHAFKAPVPPDHVVVSLPSEQDDPYLR